MNIGIDIDGVLTDEKQWHLDYGSKYFRKLYNIGINDADAFYTRDIFNVSVEEERKFWAENVWEYAKSERPRNFAREVIDKLNGNGHKIYIITAREYTSFDNEIGQKMRNIVKDWFDKNEIYYDDISFVEKSKVDVCKEKNINLMIEDNAKNIDEISKFIPVICMDASYNKSCIGDNIFRCYSWYDMYYKIKDINNIILKKKE